MSKKKDSNLIPILLLAGIGIYIFQKRNGSASSAQNYESLADRAYDAMNRSNILRDSNGRIWTAQFFLDLEKLGKDSLLVVSQIFEKKYGKMFTVAIDNYYRKFPNAKREYELFLIDMYGGA